MKTPASLLPDFSPSNDDAPAQTGLYAARVSDRVWDALLEAKAGGAPAPQPRWSAEENAAWRLYAPIVGAPGAQPLVFAQIGQSLDGRIATVSGDAGDVSGKDGLKHLHRCRALADAVVVGVGTALADSPRLTVRLVDGESPARIVIDPNGRLPDNAGFFAHGGRHFVVQTCGKDRPDGVEVLNLACGGRGIDPRHIVAALAERGFRRILVEGGGITIGRFLDAGMLDRLHVGIAPLLIGAGPAGLRSSPIEHLSDAQRPRTTVYGLGTDIIFDCAFDRAGSASTSVWPMVQTADAAAESRLASQSIASA